MKTSLIEKISSLVKKNILLCFVGVFILGGGIVFFVLDKRLDSNYVLEVKAEENGEDVNVDENLADKKIFVDLSGAVSKPGVYELSPGARVGDLLALGGGVDNDASAKWISKNLNLSKKLEDSSKIYVPFEWEFYFPESYGISKTVNKNSASSSSAEESSEYVDTVDYSDISDSGDSDTADDSGVDESGKINVNTASSSELDELPGIGPAYAEKIITNRPYKDIAEFESKSGLYKSTVENIKDLITF